MFERRPVLGLILVLNVCVLIWRISVQEPSSGLEADAASGAGSSGGGGGGALSSSGSSGADASLQLLQWNDLGGWYNAAPLLQPQPQSQLYAGKHLLSERQQSAANETGGESTARRKYYKYQIANTSLKRAAAENSAGDVVSSGSGAGGAVDSLNSISINGIRRRTKTAPKRTKWQSRQRSAATSAPATAAANGAAASAAPAPASLVTVTATTPQRPGDAADVAQLIDLHNFAYQMTQSACSARTAALILVHSAPHNIEKRSLIRETWGSVASVASASALRVIFLLGAVVEPALQQQLEHENARHGDLVQGSFVDDYRNMTYKHVMAFKWFLYNCAHAQILIKVDDDVYVNTPQLLQYLKRAQRTERRRRRRRLSPVVATARPPASPSPPPAPPPPPNASTTFTTVTLEEAAAIAARYDDAARFNASQSLFGDPRNLLFCQEYVGSAVKRSYRSKWRVSFREYAERYYPPYCPGYAIIYSADVVARLYRAAQRQKYFWIDDVHITGVLAQQTNTSITTSLRYVLFSEMCERLLDGKTDLGETEFLFAWHLISPQQIRALWRLYSAATASSPSPLSSLSPPASASASTLLSSDRGLDSYSYASYPYEEGGFR